MVKGEGGGEKKQKTDKVREEPNIDIVINDMAWGENIKQIGSTPFQLPALLD